MSSFFSWGSYCPRKGWALPAGSLRISGRTPKKMTRCTSRSWKGHFFSANSETCLLLGPRRSPTSSNCRYSNQVSLRRWYLSSNTSYWLQAPLSRPAASLRNTERSPHCWPCSYLLTEFSLADGPGFECLRFLYSCRTRLRAESCARRLQPGSLFYS